ncbi:MAG: LysR family transcriptional regulator [Desulfomonilia bacterium]|nr:LysR family transcriptional regulator [Desulfomonilia bacterium]
MDFGYKIWIRKNGETVFGIGIFNILNLVEETGSLHKAAQILKMSYRAAWGKVRDYEDRLGIGLLEKGRHGRTGAQLTPEGKAMVNHFRHVLSEMDRIVSTGPLAEIIGKVEDLKAAK